MFIGHFGVGFAGKKAYASPSLGTYFAAAQLLDALWPIFLLAGWEQDRAVCLGRAGGPSGAPLRYKLAGAPAPQREGAGHRAVFRVALHPLGGLDRSAPQGIHNVCSCQFLKGAVAFFGHAEGKRAAANETLTRWIRLNRSPSGARPRMEATAALATALS